MFIKFPAYRKSIVKFEERWRLNFLLFERPLIFSLHYFFSRVQKI